MKGEPAASSCQNVGVLGGHAPRIVSIGIRGRALSATQRESEDRFIAHARLAEKRSAATRAIARPRIGPRIASRDERAKLSPYVRSTARSAPGAYVDATGRCRCAQLRQAGGPRKKPSAIA